MELESTRMGLGKAGALAPLPEMVRPVEVALKPDARLRVGFNASNGALEILGTTSEPVVLTSATNSPTAGDWSGVWFDNDPAGRPNTITHTRDDLCTFCVD